MKLNEILELGVIELGVINDNTKISIISIRDNNLRLITWGNWYQNNILKKGEREVESFEWRNNGEFFIKLK